MNEQEWLTSTDINAMLRLATGVRAQCCGCFWCDNGDGTISMANGSKCCPRCDNQQFVSDALVSSRKLRLFSWATALQTWSGAGYQRMGMSPQEVDDNYARWYRGDTDLLNLSDGQRHEGVGTILRAQVAAQASLWGERNVGMHGPAILRDIVGNPFRPVQVVTEGGKQWLDLRTFAQKQVTWITPQTRALAQAVWDDREWKVCDVCDGAKGVSEHRAGEVRGSTCKACVDTGYVLDGELNPQRLAVLSDALEEAGCENDLILQHLRGQEKLYRYVLDDPGTWRWEWRGEWQNKGPCVRGCWVLDLVLGEI